jgi:hypothetical protein
VVGFDDAALGKVVPIDAHVFRPVVEFGKMAHFFGRHEFPRSVFVLHQGKQRVSVFEASLELELAVVIRFGLIEDVPRVDAAREEISHRVTVWTRPL